MTTAEMDLGGRDAPTVSVFIRVHLWFPFPSSKPNTGVKLMKLISALVASFLAPVVLVGAQFPTEIPLWPGGAPGSEGKTSPEVFSKSASGEISVWSIHNPSLTPYLPPKEKATRAAMLVIPGGGHRNLAITHEGYNVAEWLSERGIAAFVLKHRLARETNSTYKIEVESLADTKRAMRLIRSHADEWNLDPSRVGAIGFSAGGELVNLVCARFDEGRPDASDPIERQNCRPNFQALIYPGRSSDIQPTNGFPPVFLVCGYNDRPDIAEGLATVYLNFKKAGVPAELHIYANAGHGFGLRSTNKSAAGQWPDRFHDWLNDRGYLQIEPGPKTRKGT
jgi:endo-1,4-beta-xylanase